MQQTQWEYQVLRSRGTEPDAYKLNAKGQEGWEVVGCYALKVQEDTSYRYECYVASA